MEEGGEGVEGAASTTAILKNQKTKTRKNKDTDIRTSIDSVIARLQQTRYSGDASPVFLRTLSWQRKF